MATTKFMIKYSWKNKERYEKVETQLLKEGWEKTNYTIPGVGEPEPNENFTTWFERTWEV